MQKILRMNKENNNEENFGDLDKQPQDILDKARRERFASGVKRG